jgi:RHS repeat-associated protein
MAAANPIRWSTKYTDDETDLVYYGHRYYTLSTGRWLNRDPIEEAGGANLYGFIDNEPISNVDLLGEKSLAEIGGDVKSWIQGHFSGRGGVSHTIEPKLRFLVYAPPPVWLEANVTFAGEVFGCVHPQTHQAIAALKGSISVDGFVAVGISLTRGQPGPRNERIPNPNNPSRTVKRKNAPGEPNSGFRERNRYAELTATCTVCPNEGYTGIEGSAFFRGSAGLGWGYQFNIQKAINNTFTDIAEGWSVTGGRAWATAGISLEAGVTVSAGVVMYLQ